MHIEDGGREDARGSHDGAGQMNKLLVIILFTLVIQCLLNYKLHIGRSTYVEMDNLCDKYL